MNELSMPATGATATAHDTPAAAAHLGWMSIFAWSIGTIGPVTVLYLVSSGYLIYMTDVLGVSGAIASGLIFFVRIYDMFVDPLMGRISDRTHSRMGRRRPWMLGGAFAIAIGSLALFSVPAPLEGASHTPLIVWSLAALLIYFTGYSMFNVPYMAMPAEMTDSYHDRTRLMSMRVLFVSLSSALGAAMAPRLIKAYGGGAYSYQVTAAVIGLIGLASMLYCVVATRRARATVATVEQMPLMAQFAVVLSNKPFIILILAKLMLLMSMSSLTSSLWYMVQHVLHKDLDVASNISLAQTAGMLVLLPLWLWLARRFDKHHLFIIASFLSAAVLFSWMLVTPQDAAIALVLRGFLLGAFAGGSLLMGQSMLPDTMEYDYRRSGVRREGAYSGVYSLVEKAGFALGPTVVGVMLSIAGYHAAVPGQAAVELSAASVRALYWGVSIVPAVTTLVCVVLLRFYTLTETSLHATTKD
jgi:GPH family glycoside/pentoside/hexuronide:cation symporter